MTTADWTADLVEMTDKLFTSDPEPTKPVTITGTHPVADLFPWLGDDEMATLAASIKARGLEHPIIVDGQGRILDGRNRAKACELAGVEPTVTVYTGDDPEGYALTANIARRSLTQGQLAMIAAEALRTAPDFLGKSETAVEVAARVGLSPATLSKAATVLIYGSASLVDQVKSGWCPLSTAYVEASGEKRKAKVQQNQDEREATDVARKVERLKAQHSKRVLRTVEHACDLLCWGVADGDVRVRVSIDEAILTVDSERRRDELFEAVGTLRGLLDGTTYSGQVTVGGEPWPPKVEMDGDLEPLDFSEPGHGGGESDGAGR